MQLEIVPAPFPSLTVREREVAMLLASGERNQDIAKKLGVSVKTVDTHRANLLEKLKCEGNVALCRFAIRNGWIKP